MVILALETATRAGSLALWLNERPERRGHNERPERRGHNEEPGPAMIGDPSRTHGVRLPGELQTFVKAAGLTLADVDLFAVIVGPGSFTGLRVGLATVQGLALATNRRVIGVPTLDAMATGWNSGLRAMAGQADPHAGTLVTCLDAARGDLFYAAFDLSARSSGNEWLPILGPKVGTPAEMAGDLAGYGHSGAITIVGDDVARHATVFEAAIPGVVIDSVMPNLAAAAAQLAFAHASSAVSPHALRPLYVRRTDAEIARERHDAAKEQTARVQDAASVFVVTTAADVAEVVALQARAFGNAWGAEALKGEPAADSVARLYAMRDASGALIAYCAAWKIVDELHINSLAVDPVHRRQGIATALLTRVLTLAAAEGAAGATLEVRQSNEAGRALYHRLGFRVEGVRPGYYQNPREDALILWRRNLGKAAVPSTYL